jgi:hypothetical protein
MRSSPRYSLSLDIFRLIECRVGEGFKLANIAYKKTRMQVRSLLTALANAELAKPC